MQKKLILNAFLKLCFLTFFSSSAFATAPPYKDNCMPVVENMQGANLLYFGFHYQDNQNQFSASDLVYSKNFDAFFERNNFNRMADLSGEYVLGESGVSHWLRFCLSNTTNIVQNLVLAAAPAVLAEIDFYPQKKGLKAFQTGNRKPFSSRDINSPQYHFNVQLQAGETQDFYLRVKSRSKAYIRASISSEPEYLIAKDGRESLDGLYVGVLLGLMLYTMLLYIWVRDPLSLLYMIWCSSIIVLFAAVDGRILQYVLPDNPERAYSFIIISYPLCVLVSAFFARQFIRLKEFPLLDKVGHAIIAVCVVVIAVAYPKGHVVYFKACAMSGFLVVVYFGVIAPFYGMVSRRSTHSKYLLMAQLPLVVCIIDRTLFTMAVSSEYVIPYTPKVGLGATMVLMALCNGLITYREKYQAQDIAIEQLEISNSLKSNFNNELQVEVEQKTTQIRKINAELEQQKQKLIKLDEVKSTFFANISHEFRTPITLIQGPLSDLLANERYPEKSSTPSVINSAIRQSKSLQAMVDQLLMLSKFDGDSLSLRASKINVSDAVNLITTQFYSFAESKKIKLSFQSEAPEVSAYIDIEKLQVMLNNLLSNAFKFTPASGRVVVDVSSAADRSMLEGERSTDEYVEIRVTDTGHGIPDDELDYVFDRFFQSRSSALNGSGIGTGIGLTLVKEFAMLHGGYVEVAHRRRTVPISRDQNQGIDQNKKGTVFCIRLPLGKAHLSDNEIIVNGDIAPLIGEESSQIGIEQSENQPKAEVISPKGDRPTVLVVDDNDDMRAYICGHLLSDYRVIEAQDGVEAEAVANKQLPDLIITDLMMPKRDGLAFVESLKTSENNKLANTPVIMLTAKASLDDRLSGLLAAVDDYLTKPFDARELKLRVSNLLKKNAQFHAFYSAGEPIAADNLKESIQSDKDQFIGKARSIVDQYLANPAFGVNELAEHLHVSRATLARRLSEKGNFTPSEFIRHCRLDKARQLSEQGSVRSVKELAGAVGFSQAGYFSRLYQKTFNTAPI